MKFSIQHLFFGDLVEEFEETKAPEWLMSKEYYWFWTEKILTLNVGESRETDFRKITRID